MGFLFCYLFHNINWHSDKKAVDLDGVVGTYGKCSCGKKYFQVLDSNTILPVPEGTMKAFKIKQYL